MQKQILVVDDDQEILNLISSYLEKNGFSVVTAVDGEQGIAKVESVALDLIVLDIMMPGIDGFEVCRTIRQQSKVPIIMLTAGSDETDRIVGLEIGADDYMEKPFNPRELLARIKAVLRRSEEASAKPKTINRLSFSDWTLDILNRELIHKSGQQETLSGADYNLLMGFLNKPGQVLSRDDISNLLRGREALPYDRSIDVQISRLRQKLKDDGKSPQLIKTVRGAGYLLASEVTPLGD